MEEWSTTWSDPNLDGSGSPIVLSDDFEDVPTEATYNFVGGEPLPGDVTGGKLILRRLAFNPYNGDSAEYLSWNVDEANRPPPGPVVTRALFTGELLPAPAHYYSVNIFSFDPALPLPMEPQPPPYQVALIVYVFDGAVYAGLWDDPEASYVSHRLLGNPAMFAQNSSVELQIELVDDGSGLLLPEGRVCINGGTCVPMNIPGDEPPEDLGAAPKNFQHGSSFGVGSKEEVNYLEISLPKYLANGTDLYNIAFDAGKYCAASCKLATPSDPAGSACSIDEVIHEDLTYAELTAEIGTGTGADWTLTWDEGLSTETVATIDFGSVSASEWLSLPTITNPLDGASGVSADTSIDWTWPPGADLDRVEVLLLGPNNEQRESDELEHPPNPVSWTPDPPLDPGLWQAVVFNGSDIRDVPEGLSISGDAWVLENSEWLAADSIDISNFTVVPVCGNDVVEAGEECDDGNTDPGDCCSPTCQYESAATVCRAAADLCDAAEYCSGSSDTCPADAFLPAMTVCRAGSGDLCDPEELCTGSDPSCPPDTVSSAGTVCDAGSGDLCDPDEVCSGISGEPCPADHFEPDSTVCRTSAGVCDLPELCPGVADAACPGDAFEPEGSPCDDGDVCTVEDVCNSGICSGSPAPDFDEDGFCDPADNCPFIGNEGQANSDALPAGDVCQCGDLDNDGSVEADDLLLARQNLMGQAVPGADLTRCNVIGPSDGGVSDCDVADIYVLQRVVAGEPVTVENTCQAYTGQ